jgi:hypothetical protein
MVVPGGVFLEVGTTSAIREEGQEHCPTTVVRGREEAEWTISASSAWSRGWKP